jgi:hypothetical protein
MLLPGSVLDVGRRRQSGPGLNGFGTGYRSASGRSEPEPDWGSAYGSGINVGKDSRRAAWSTPSPCRFCRSMSGQLGDDRSERISGVGADDKVGEAALLTSSQDFLDGRRRVTWKYQ